jgi:fucose 4-O-acetylase-like acetyltransferase
LKKLIAKYPMLFGALIGLIIVGGSFTVAWVPRFDQAYEGHKRLVEAVWFTTAFYVVGISRVWRWRHRGPIAFWASFLTLMLIHVVGIFLYSIYFRPLLVWQWIPLFLVEFLVLFSFVDWSTRRFGHPNRQQHAQLADDQAATTEDGA